MIQIILGPLLLIATLGLMIAVIVGMIVSGPARWVRVLTVLLIIVAPLDFAIMFSPSAALALVGFTLGTTLLSSFIGMLAWGMPAKLELTEQPFAPPDKLLSERAARWTAEAGAAGFTSDRDLQTAWRFGGETRYTWLRLLRDPEARCWAEVAAMVRPKVSAIRIVSPLVDGRVIETSNRRTDSATLGDSATIAVKVPESSSFARLLEAHLRAIASAGAEPCKIDDPARCADEARQQWRERMLKQGRLVQRGELLKVPLAATPRLLLQSLANLVRG